MNSGMSSRVGALSTRAGRVGPAGTRGFGGPARSGAGRARGSAHLARELGHGVVVKHAGAVLIRAALARAVPVGTARTRAVFARGLFARRPLASGPLARPAIGSRGLVPAGRAGRLLAVLRRRAGLGLRVLGRRLARSAPGAGEVRHPAAQVVPDRARVHLGHGPGPPFGVLVVAHAQPPA